MTRILLRLALVVLLMAGCRGDSSEPTERVSRQLPAGVQSKVGLSRKIHIDRKYKSMEGPIANATFTLLDGPPVLLWITGYRSQVVYGDGTSPAPGDFTCHTNMVFDGAAHASIFGSTRPKTYDRLFTTSQGQFEVQLPDGFGIPVLSNQVLGLNSQAVNTNHENADVDIRFKLAVEYISDAEAGARMKPLFPSLAWVMARVDGDTAVYGVEHPTEMQAGASCLPGEVAPQSVSAEKKGLLTDDLGREFTGHWVVPPGRELRRTLVNELLAIPYDTTIHYIGVHVHPFAESLALRDLTTGETLFTSHAGPPETGGIGLADVGIYSSVEGIRVYRDHDYEMVSVYDNTSGENQDAMSTFFIYFHDPEAEQALQKLRQAG